MPAYDKEAWRASVTNGKIPLSKLDKIRPEQFDPDLGGPAMMQPEAAAAMGALLRQAWEDGAEDLRVKYSYRTFEVQERKWQIYLAGGNLAARPGTSNHGWAVAVDFTGLGAEESLWLERKARRYGYLMDVPGENWHWTYQEHVWEGDEMTDKELKMLQEVHQFMSGQLALDERWTKEDPNPEPAAEREKFFKEGFRVLKRAYNRP